jgi:DNA-binding NarL/FixJ family response regulator
LVAAFPPQREKPGERVKESRQFADQNSAIVEFARRVLVWANESKASRSWRIVGPSNREIGERLSISARTIECHMASILREWAYGLVASCSNR